PENDDQDGRVRAKRPPGARFARGGCVHVLGAVHGSIGIVCLRNNRDEKLDGNIGGFSRSRGCEFDADFDGGWNIRERLAPGIIPVGAVIIGKLQSINTRQKQLLIGSVRIAGQKIASHSADEVASRRAGAIGGILQGVINSLNFTPGFVGTNRAAGGKNLECGRLSHASRGSVAAHRAGEVAGWNDAEQVTLDGGNCQVRRQSLGSNFGHVQAHMKCAEEYGIRGCKHDGGNHDSQQYFQQRESRRVRRLKLISFQVHHCWVLYNVLRCTEKLLSCALNETSAESWWMVD